MTTDVGEAELSDGQVRPEHRCPRCGENRVDSLTWIDPEGERVVRCDTCGCVYDPEDWFGSVTRPTVRELVETHKRIGKPVGHGEPCGCRVDVNAENGGVAADYIVCPEHQGVEFPVKWA